MPIGRGYAALAPAGSLEFHNGVERRGVPRAARDAPTRSSRCRSTRASACRWSRRWRWARPAILSDIPIFREIGGEAALYVAPMDAAAVAAAVKLLEDPAQWRARSRAVDRAGARFDWEHSAQELYEVLERVSRRPPFAAEDPGLRAELAPANAKLLGSAASSRASIAFCASMSSQSGSCDSTSIGSSNAISRSEPSS